MLWQFYIVCAAVFNRVFWCSYNHFIINCYRLLSCSFIICSKYRLKSTCGDGHSCCTSCSIKNHFWRFLLLFLIIILHLFQCRDSGLLIWDVVEILPEHVSTIINLYLLYQKLLYSVWRAIYVGRLNSFLFIYWLGYCKNTVCARRVFPKGNLLFW